MRYCSKTITRWTFGLAVTLAILAGPAWAGEPPGAASPQAVLERFRLAMNRGDIAEQASCVTPKKRREWAVKNLRLARQIMEVLRMNPDVEASAADESFSLTATTEQVANFRARLRQKRVTPKADLHAFYVAILRKHGLAGRPVDLSTKESIEAGAAALLAGVDETVLIDDLTAFIDSFTRPERREQRASPFTTLAHDYQIAGDKATAREGYLGAMYYFARVNGRWYLEGVKGDD